MRTSARSRNPHHLLPLALVLAAANARAQGPLLPAELVSTGNDPIDVKAGDLTGDALPDAAVVHESGHVLAVLPGDGAGALGSKVTYDIGGAGVELALAPLGGGSGLDVAVAVPAAGAIAVLLDDGSGGLGLASYHPAGLSPLSLALGDADGDGDADAVAAGGPTETVAVLLGDGSGGFAPPAQVPMIGPSGTFPVDAVLADSDLDGDLDLLVANRTTNQLEVYPGDGSGGFGPGTGFGSCAYIASMELGDLDEEGHADVLLATDNVFGDQPQVLFGGPFGFTPTDAGGVTNTNTCAIADVNGDGHLDLAFPSFDHVVIQAGDGAGAFSSPASDASLYVAVGLESPEFADFDLDGVLDLVVCVPGAEDAASLILGQGGGEYADPVRFLVTPQTLGSKAIGVEPIDSDSDGDLDLAMLVTGFDTQGKDKVLVCAGDGAGGFATPSAFLDLSLWTGGFDSGDLNGDGLADLVAGRYGSSSAVHPFLADGAGWFSATGSYPVASGVIDDLSLADFDADGALDVAAGTDAGFFGTGVLVVSPGDGAGGFLPGATLAAGNFFAIAAGDLDLDGAPDVAGADWNAGSAVLARNDGTGGFLPPTSLPLGYSPFEVDLGDLTDDGDPDVVCAGDGEASLFAGDGQFGFAAAVPLATGARPSGIVLGDLDADGRRDLAIACQDSHQVYVYLADGSGGLAPERRLGSGYRPVALAAADLDADGRLDLAATHRQYNEAWVYLGQRLEPAGVLAYGAGTPGCAGGHGLFASGVPAVGAAGLELLSTNAPPGGIGIRLLGSSPDFAGTDPFGLGIALHVDPFGVFLLADLVFESDQLGQGVAPLAIPPQPALAGKTVFAQAVWISPGPCLPTPLGLSSSAGLRITVQP